MQMGKADASAGPGVQDGRTGYDTEAAEEAEKEHVDEAGTLDCRPAGLQREETSVPELKRGTETQGAHNLVDCKQAGVGGAVAEEGGLEQEGGHSLIRPSSGMQSSPSKGHAEAPLVPAPGPMSSSDAAAFPHAKQDDHMQCSGALLGTLEQVAVAGAGGGGCGDPAAVEQGSASEGVQCLHRPAVPRRQRGKRRFGKPGAAWAARVTEEPEIAEEGVSGSATIVRNNDPLCDPRPPTAALRCLQVWRRTAVRPWRAKSSSSNRVRLQPGQQSRAVRRPSWQQTPHCGMTTRSSVQLRQAMPCMRLSERAAHRVSGVAARTMLTGLKVCS